MKKIILTSFLALASLYASAQDPFLERRKERQRVFDSLNVATIPYSRVIHQEVTRQENVLRPVSVEQQIVNESEVIPSRVSVEEQVQETIIDTARRTVPESVVRDSNQRTNEIDERIQFQVPESLLPVRQDPRSERDLEGLVVNLGRISIGDVVNSFRIRPFDEEGIKTDEDRDLLYGDGKKIGTLSFVGDGYWEYNGSLKDLALGKNYFSTEFIKESGLKTPVSFILETTNDAPVPGNLNYKFVARDGEILSGTLEPVKEGNNYFYKLGEIHGKYMLSELSVLVEDIDDNLVKDKSLVRKNDVVVGNFVLDTENNIFSYTREESQNSGLGQYVVDANFPDKVGAFANIYFLFEKADKPVRIQEVIMQTERGVETKVNYDEPETSRRGLFRRR
jgi:hypothetical protein